MGYLRASNDGPNGSGKTCTTAQLAVGLAIEFGDRKPVHVFDSSDRWKLWKRDIFDVEQIPLVITYGESIAVIQKSIDRAMSEDCSVWVGDDLTVPWLEGVKSFARENGNLTFDKRQQLMNQWNRVVTGFKHGQFDSIACGRLGYVWENIEDEDGEEQLHQGDGKFNAGGGQNFGYDAELELTMRRRVRKVKSLFRGKLVVEHIVDVRKDAFNRINGRQFVFPDWTGRYERGMYKPVLDAFREHILCVRDLEHQPFDATSSEDLIVNGKTAWGRDQADRKALLEELAANFDMTFPGGEGKSKITKMFRDLTLEFLNGFISWSRMEDDTPTKDIERNVLIVKAMRKRVEAGEIPTDQDSLKMLCNLATEDVLHPGRSLTLIEALGKKSIALATAKTGRVA